MDSLPVELLCEIAIDIETYREMLAIPEFARLTLDDNKYFRKKFTTLASNESGNVWYLNGNFHREDGPAIEHNHGTRDLSNEIVVYREYFKHGDLHREDGPAVEYTNGDKEWCRNGKLHREDGPAVEYGNGDCEWHLNDELHREGGPAVVYANGNCEWWVNGELHREGGPAIDYITESLQEWYLNGKLHRVDGPAHIVEDYEEYWVNGVKIEITDDISTSAFK